MSRPQATASYSMILAVACGRLMYTRLMTLTALPPWFWGYTLCYGDRLDKVFGDGSWNRYVGALPGLITQATPFFRRIVRDYAYTLSSPVGWLLLVNIQITLQRIKPTPQL